MEILITCLAICFAKTLEVTLQSINQSLMARGERRLAAPLVVCECILWGLVIYSLWNIIGTNGWIMFSYCFGYGAGMFLGSIIESKILTGTSSVQMIVNKDCIDVLKQYLITHQYGFTILPGYGVKDESYMVVMILARREAKKAVREITQYCRGRVFIISTEVNHVGGGYGISKGRPF